MQHKNNICIYIASLKSITDIFTLKKITTWLYLPQPYPWTWHGLLLVVAYNQTHMCLSSFWRFLYSLACHWWYWSIYISFESSSLKFHPRLYLCNWKSVYILLSGVWLKMVQLPVNLRCRHFKLRSAAMKMKERTTTEGFHYRRLKNTVSFLLVIVHMLEWITCAPAVCFMFECWRKWPNNTQCFN